MPELEFEVGGVTRRAAVDTLIVAGWTGRDAAAVERHIAELEALACDLVPTPPIRDAVAAWVRANPDRDTLRCLAKRLHVDAGYLSRLIGSSRMQGTEIDGHAVRGAFRREMPLEDAERIVRALGLAPVELREHGL